MRWSTRELVLIGVFGALWGSVEVGVGGALHAFRVPFAGAALTAIGMLVALSGRVFVDRRGTILFIGLVTALLKMLSVGGLVIRPMLGIVVESLIAEGVLLVAPRSRVGYAAAGGSAVLWTLVHPFLAGALFAGQRVLAVYANLIESGARLVGVDRSAVMTVVIVIVGAHLALGALSGILAWSAARTVRQRLNPAGEGGR